MKLVDKLPPVSELGFGQHFCDHMAIAYYRNGTWEKAKIVPTEDLKLHPGAKVFHYAQEIFEGCKAYRMNNGDISLFRPQDNVRRMTSSAKIMSMPPFPEEDFLKTMKDLVGRFKHLVPERPGAMYLRPTMLGISPTLGVAPSQDYVFFILLSPVGGYFGTIDPNTLSSISLWISHIHVRAVRGGLGAAKTGANYAASLTGVAEAKKRGFTNVLFLDAIDRRYIEELSGMNFFMVEGGVLHTPPLGDTILDGVTRKAILDIAIHNNIPVSEEPIDVEKLISGLENGRVSETFACGTAASITSIKKLGFRDKEYTVGSGQPGPLTTRLYKSLINIQYGAESPVSPEWIVRC